MLVKLFNYGFSLLTLANPDYVLNHTPSFCSFILCPQKNLFFRKFFDDVIACDLRFSPTPNPKSWLRLCIKSCAICIADTGCCILILLTYLHERLLATLQRFKAAKYTLHCFQSKIFLVWKYGMKYGRNF